MLLSIFIISFSSIPLAFLNENSNWAVYPLGAIQGLGIAIMLNTATSLIGDVIGKDADNSAFVYGSYSLFDKFANGILLFWMIDSFSANKEALKLIMAGVPTICAILSYIMVYIGQKFYSHKLAKITGVRQK